MEQECSDDFLFSLAKKLVRLTRVDFGLDSGVLEAVEKDGTDSEGKSRLVLQRWHEKYGHSATYELLARCCLKSDMANMADTVCKERRLMLPQDRGKWGGSLGCCSVYLRSPGPPRK